MHLQSATVNSAFEDGVITASMPPEHCSEVTSYAPPGSQLSDGGLRSPAVIAMGSLGVIVPPHPKLPSSSQHAQLSSDIGHEGDKQVKKQPRTLPDGVGHEQANRPTTRMQKHPPNVGESAFLNTTPRLMLMRSFEGRR